MKPLYKKIIAHIAAIVVFLAVGFAFFSPVLDGKRIYQSDMAQFEGGNKDLADYEKATGERAGWTDGMFGGMPAYQLTMPEHYNVFKSFSAPITLGSYSFSVGIAFLLMLGFYVFMVAMGANPLLAAAAAVAYSLGSYNIIITVVGHITKAWAMAMIAPILGGIILVMRKKRLTGAALFTLALGLQVNFNHIQITYYTLLAALVLALSCLVYAIIDQKRKSGTGLKDFGISCAVLALCALVAVMSNASHLKLNSEYVKQTMRGGSELTVKPNEQAQSQNNKKGLDINYAYSWSYGLGESFSVLVPDVRGGGSSDHRWEQTASRRINQVQTTAPKESQHPQINSVINQYVGSTYWGEQPFTAGTVYFGAIVCMLALMGFILLDGRMRWWLLGASVLSFILALGSNAMWINGFLFDHLPFYNKFRTPSMALVIANVTFVVAGFLGLKELLYGKKDLNIKKRALFIASGVTGGLCLLFALFPTLFADFTCSKDAVFDKMLGDSFLQALEDDRKAVFVSDAWRSLLFIAVAFVVLLLGVRRVIKKEYLAIAVVGLACVIDLWGVDKRYIGKDDYKSPYEMTPQPTAAIQDIEQRVESEKPAHYRVFNTSLSTFNDASTSYFFPSIGGYHGAKLQRYQDIIDFYFQNRAYVQKDLADTTLLAKNQVRQFYAQYADQVTVPNLGVLNMLDARYVILPLGQEGGIAVENPEACGAAWFVPSVRWVNTPDEEILALDNFDPRAMVVLNERYKDVVKGLGAFDSAATISYEPEAVHNPDYKKYTYQSSSKQIAVFSEVYYPNDWKAYIDGKPTEILQADYVLRALVLPSGKHTVEMRFEPDSLRTFSKVNLIGSVLVSLIVIAAIVVPILRKKGIIKDKKQSKEA